MLTGNSFASWAHAIEVIHDVVICFNLEKFVLILNKL